MKERSIIGLYDKVIRGFYTLMGIAFVPVFICVLFLDKHIKYNEGLRPITLLPNSGLLAVALTGVAVVCLLAWELRKIELTAKVNIISTIVLALLFTLLYFVNVWIAREIAFKFGWDIMVVSTHAVYLAEGNSLGYQAYFSINSNNIPIVYFLKKLYVRAMEMENYPYINEFIWIQVNCIWISLGGFFGSLSVKKLTQKVVPSFIYFLLYLAVAGLTPWKIAPYTDIYGIAFSTMALYFYLCYRETRRVWLKYLLISLALISAAAGGLVKPSIYILIFAVAGVEIICLMRNCREKWRYVLFEVVLIIALFWVKDIYMAHMIEDVGLDINKNVEATWQHYFHMGQNDETTGSYSPYDKAIFGEFQESKKERNKAALERAFDRIEKRGIAGNFSFVLSKMTMVFNEGTFGWCREAGIYENYPANLAKNDKRTQFLRNIFWPDMVYTGRYNTFCQLVWIFCLIGIAGFCFQTKEKREKQVILAVSFLGIFFYQMLFEARARYLIVFLPLIVVISICGLWQYVEWTVDWLQSKRDSLQNK